MRLFSLASVRVHETVGVLQSEVVDGVALEIWLGVDGQWLAAVAVGQDDGSSVVDFHLAVGAVGGTLSVDADVR